MAIVLALMIVGWLLAFALGSQAGFEAQPVDSLTVKPAQSSGSEASATNYREPASVA